MTLTRGPYAVIEKLSEGCNIPWHWHTASEEIVVLRGRMVLEYMDSKPKELSPGAYYFNPAHHIHRGTIKKASTLYISVNGRFDIHYVDDAGKEISPAQALGQGRPGGEKSNSH